MLKLNKNKIRFTANAAMIAALYVALTYICNLFGLAKFAVQLRFSEALTILPIFMPSAVPGLFVGCVLANLLTNAAVWDVIFGSLATLIGAFLTRKLRKTPYLAFLPPIVANTLVVPPIVCFVYGSDMAMPLVYLTVFAGEVLSCGVLGFILYRALLRNPLFSKGNML